MKKVILITGCSSGLGLVLARRLSVDHIVYASMRNSSKIEYFEKDSSPSFIPIRIDVRESESIDSALSVIKEKHNKLDILINNAGIMQVGFFEDVPEKVVRELLETNFFGVVTLTKKALPLLKESGDAKIINISSSSGLMAMPALSAYASSKWAVEGFSESLRFELYSMGIQVLLIEPGLIRTELLQENFKVCEDPNSNYSKEMDQLLKMWKGRDPKTFLDPAEVAKVIEKRIYQKNPPFRTVLSRLSKIKLLLKRTLPYSLYEKIVLKVLKI